MTVLAEAVSRRVQVGHAVPSQAPLLGWDGLKAQQKLFPLLLISLSLTIGALRQTGSATVRRGTCQNPWLAREGRRNTGK